MGLIQTLYVCKCSNQFKLLFKHDSITRHFSPIKQPQISLHNPRFFANILSALHDRQTFKATPDTSVKLLKTNLHGKDPIRSPGKLIKRPSDPLYTVQEFPQRKSIQRLSHRNAINRGVRIEIARIPSIRS